MVIERIGQKPSKLMYHKAVNYKVVFWMKKPVKERWDNLEGESKELSQRKYQI
jgi:hypothetical protein